MEKDGLIIINIEKDLIYAYVEVCLVNNDHLFVKN